MTIPQNLYADPHSLSDARLQAPGEDSDDPNEQTITTGKYLVLDAACGSNIGRLRTNNEDNCFFDGKTLPEDNAGIPTPWSRRFRNTSVCFGVFDGMGGAEDGQTASYLAAQAFAADCGKLPAGGMLSESFFLSAISHMNSVVFAEAESRRNNMGTTTVLIGFCETALYICNVGDSRAYRFRDGQLTHITMDHVESLPPFLQGDRRRKPKLSQCIGISPEELLIEPYVAQGVLREGDVFLLCSDGLTDMVPDEELRLLLAEGGELSRTVQRLIDAALAHGGKDNVTVLLVKTVSVPKERDELE